MHGYQIISELERRSDGRWRPSAGSVYPTLQQLEDEGLVRASEKDGRRVFELTEAGRTAADTASTGGAGTPWAFGAAPTRSSCATCCTRSWPRRSSCPRSAARP